MKFTPTLWECVVDIFDQVELPPAERGRWLDAACGSDDVCRKYMAHLLEADDASTDRITGTTVRGDDPMIGITLKNRYLVKREIGRGGFSVVYLAFDTHLYHRPVVVKALLQQGTHTEYFERKFRQESEALARVHHPGVVGVFDRGDTPDGRPFLVLDFVEGVSLRALVQPQGMELRQVAGLVQQLGQALHAAHAKGVYHRDLKPENVIVRDAGTPEQFAVIIDFGIATVKNSELAGSLKTEIVGSIPYMAPEQLDGKPELRSDIYALGVIAYEAITGFRPFPDGLKNFAQRQQGVQVKPRQLRKELSEGAEAIVLKALSWNPEDRHSRADVFGNELANALMNPSLALVDARVQESDDAVRVKWDRATSRKVAAEAAAMLSRDRELAILLAMEAVRVSATREAEDVLRRSLISSPVATVIEGPEGLRVNATQFSPDGQQLLAVFEDGSVRIWRIASARDPIVLARESILYELAEGTHAMFSPDGASVLTVPYVGDYAFGERDTSGHAARIWDAATGRLRRELKHATVQNAVFSPDGQRIVTGGFGFPDNAVMWDAGTGARLYEITDHEHEVVSASFTWDGFLLATAGKDDKVRIRTAADGEVLAVLRVPGRNYMSAAVFSPDARWVLTLSREDPLRLWDWKNAPAHGVELRLPDGAGYTAEFSPDSTLLLTTANETFARIWQVETGRNLYELPHEDFINEAAFSPGGRWILTASCDRTAALWDATTGKRLLDFGTAGRSRTTAAFSPDGSRIATGTCDGQVLIYDCEFCGSAPQLLRLASSRVKRALTEEEKAKYGLRLQ